MDRIQNFCYSMNIKPANEGMGGNIVIASLIASALGISAIKGRNVRLPETSHKTRDQYFDDKGIEKGSPRVKYAKNVITNILTDLKKIIAKLKTSDEGAKILGELKDELIWQNPKKLNNDNIKIWFELTRNERFLTYYSIFNCKCISPHVNYTSNLLRLYAVDGIHPNFTNAMNTCLSLLKKKYAEEIAANVITIDGDTDLHISDFSIRDTHDENVKAYKAEIKRLKKASKLY